LDRAAVDVATDPPTAELLGNGGSRTGTDEKVENDVARVGACLN
jgi:hypothetical protein